MENIYAMLIPFLPPTPANLKLLASRTPNSNRYTRRSPDHVQHEFKLGLQACMRAEYSGDALARYSCILAYSVSNSDRLRRS